MDDTCFGSVPTENAFIGKVRSQEKGGKFLCLSCSWGHHSSDGRDSYVQCTVNGPQKITRMVIRCSQYLNSTLPSLDDMRRVSINLEDALKDVRRRAAGFRAEEPK